MGTIRAVVLTFALAAVSVVGIPLQALALATGSPFARTIPVVFHRILGRLAGIRRTVVGAPAAGRPLLLAGNHVSWLDITVLSAVLPVSFVAKREVATWPVFGLFAKLQRSVFVDRERKRLTAETAAEMGGRLAAGDVLMLFAEGTSGDHNRVLPFRTALIGAARAAIAGGGAATVWVQPVSIAYTRWNGLPIGRRERPRVAWYGDMDLGPHLWRVLREGRIDAIVTFGTPIAVGRGDDRKQVAARAEASVRSMTRAAQRGQPARA